MLWVSGTRISKDIWPRLSERRWSIEGEEAAELLVRRSKVECKQSLPLFSTTSRHAPIRSISSEQVPKEKKGKNCSVRKKRSFFFLVRVSVCWGVPQMLQSDSRRVESSCAQTSGSSSQNANTAEYGRRETRSALSSGVRRTLSSCSTWVTFSSMSRISSTRLFPSE